MYAIAYFYEHAMHAAAFPRSRDVNVTCSDA